MGTIPEPLYDRLANASITVEDGAMLIGLLELLGSGVQLVDRVTSSPGSTESPSVYAAGAWTALVAHYLSYRGSAMSKGATDAVLDGIVEGRARRQELLREPGRQWQFVFGEAALWSPPGSRETQLAQLDHLLTMIECPGTELGIVAMRAPMHILPISGFRVLDEEFVFMESLIAEHRLAGEQIAPIISAFNHLREVATTGPAAVALIQRVAAELRGRSGRGQR